MNDHKTELQSTELQSIDLGDLDGVQGGSWWGATKALGKTVGKKVLAPIGAFTAGYAGGKGYSDSRAKGNGVASSIGNGVLQAGKDVAGYELWGGAAERTFGYGDGKGN